MSYYMAHNKGNIDSVFTYRHSRSHYNSSVAVAYADVVAAVVVMRQ